MCVTTHIDISLCSGLKACCSWVEVNILLLLIAVKIAEDLHWRFILIYLFFLILVAEGGACLIYAPVWIGTLQRVN